MRIGTQLYRYIPLSGIWEYTVIGIHEYEDRKQFAVRSESCTHGWKCELLIAYDDNGRLKYVSMLNNDEEDDQSYWHVDDETRPRYFYSTKAEAHLECYTRLEQKYKDKIQQAKTVLAREEKQYKEIAEALELAREDVAKAKR